MANIAKESCALCARKRARRVTCERRFTQLPDVVARTVGDACEHIRRGDGRFGKKEPQFLKLLVRGEEIAFRALGTFPARICRRA